MIAGGMGVFHSGFLEGTSVPYWGRAKSRAARRRELTNVSVYHPSKRFDVCGIPENSRHV